MYRILSTLIVMVLDWMVIPVAKFLYGVIYKIPYKINHKWYIVIRGFPVMNTIDGHDMKLKFYLDLKGVSKNTPIIVHPRENHRSFYNGAIAWFNSYLRKAWNSPEDNTIYQDENGSIVFYNVFKQFRLAKIKFVLSAIIMYIGYIICGLLIPFAWKIHRREYFNGETLLEIILTAVLFSLLAMVIYTVTVYFLEQNKLYTTKENKFNRTLKNVYKGWYYKLK